MIPPGYTVFRKDRNRHGGGVLLLIRDSLNASLRSDLDDQCEVLWVSIPTKSSTILFSVFINAPMLLSLFWRLCVPLCALHSAKADLFNRYFYSVFTDEHCSDLSSLGKSNKLSSIIQSINFTTQDVFQELSQLNPNKSCGPDLLIPLLLKGK